MVFIMMMVIALVVGMVLQIILNFGRTNVRQFGRNWTRGNLGISISSCVNGICYDGWLS